MIVEDIGTTLPPSIFTPLQITQGPPTTAESQDPTKADGGATAATKIVEVPKEETKEEKEMHQIDDMQKELEDMLTRLDRVDPVKELLLAT